MANQRKPESNEKPRVNIWLLAGLGVIAVVALLFFIGNNASKGDPTLTAAPKIVSTPDHPITIRTKSPEVYEEQLREAGVPEKDRKMHAPNLN